MSGVSALLRDMLVNNESFAFIIDTATGYMIAHTKDVPLVVVIEEEVCDGGAASVSDPSTSRGPAALSLPVRQSPS